MRHGVGSYASFEYENILAERINPLKEPYPTKKDKALLFMQAQSSQPLHNALYVETYPLAALRPF